MLLAPGKYNRIIIRLQKSILFTNYTNTIYTNNFTIVICLYFTFSFAREITISTKKKYIYINNVIYEHIFL